MADTKLTTCSVEMCERPPHSRGYCGMHYKRVAAHGTPYAPCKTCGAEIEGKGHKNYCSEACRPACVVQECGRDSYVSGLCRTHYKHRRAGRDLGEIKPYAIVGCSVDACKQDHCANGLCAGHYARFLATGNPERPCITCGKDCELGYGPKTFCSFECRPSCGVDGCERKAVGRAVYCSVHQSSIYKRGKLPEYTWAAEKKCIVCGIEHDHPRFRKVCSARCQQLLHRNGGKTPPTFKQCTRCTTIIDLTERHPSGRKRRADVKVCDACHKAKYTRHRVSVTELADRDGTDCTICGEAVDMTLVFPHMFRASVDHILPYASGGSHDPENLALSHLWCNLVKQNRPGFTF